MDKIIDLWFSSECWAEIVTDAERGCPDSIDLMEEVSDHLCSLTWHLKNRSDDDRIVYELSYLSQLCDDFEVAEE